MATLSTDEMRLYIIQAYPGPLWKKRVKKMKARQVAAIYFNLQEKAAKKKEIENRDGGRWEQMTIKDYIQEKNNADTNISNL